MTSKEIKATTTSDTSKIYEVGYLLLPTIAEEKVEAEVASLKALISKHGGSVFAEEAPKLIALTYEMSKEIDTKKHRFNEAYFGWVKFEMEKEGTLDLKKAFDTNPSVLRYLLINTVRENTMYTPPKIEEVAGEGAEGEASPEEIDKSIEALVA